LGPGPEEEVDGRKLILKCMRTTFHEIINKDFSHEPKAFKNLLSESNIVKAEFDKGMTDERKQQYLSNLNKGNKVYHIEYFSTETVVRASG